MIFPLRAILALLLARMYPLGVEPLTFLEPGRDSWTILGIDMAPPVVVAIVAVLLAAAGAFVPGRLARFVAAPAPLLAHAALLFVFHWPLWIEEHTVLGGSATGVYLGSLLPYAAMAGASWAVRRPSRMQVAFVAAPILLMLVLNVATLESETLMYVSLVYPFALVLAMLAVSALLLAAAAPLMRLVLRARPLAPGPLRDRLGALAARSGFSCRDIVVFDAGGVVNAFVAGPFAAVRTVFVSRELVDRMSPREIECVIAHETAHSLLRHLGTLALYIAALTLAFGGIADVEGLPEPVAAALPIAAFAAAAACFVWTSRRFESEADIVGASIVESPLDAAATLHRVARLGRLDPRRPSWRHFSIERRIAILLDPEKIRGVLRQARLARGTTAALVALGVPLFGLSVALQTARAPERREQWEAFERAESALHALEAGDSERAARDLRASIDVVDMGILRYYLARAYQAQGLDAMAMEERRRAREMNPRFPRERLDLELNRP